MKISLSKPERFAFWSSIIGGLLAHLYMLANNFQFHDEVSPALYSLGAGGLLFGRGSNFLLYKIARLLFGSDFINLPLFNGALSILIFAITAIFIVRILKVQDSIFSTLIGVVMVIFPSITSVMGYRTMAYTYALAFFSVTFGVYLVIKDATPPPPHNKYLKIFLCVTLCTFAIGIYQAVIPFILSLATLFFFRYFIENDLSWRKFFTEILKWAGISIAFMTAYVAFTLLSYYVWPRGFEFSSYQGINEAGSFSFSEILYRIVTAYKRAFFPPLNTSGDMYPQSVRFFFYAVLIISILLTINIIVKLYSASRRKGLQCLIISLVLPVMINFIYVMCSEQKSHIYSIMLYTQIFVFVYLCVAAEINMEQNFIKRENIKIYLRKTVITLLGIVCFLYIRYDNICYLKAYYIQTRAISYFTVLQSRIQNTSGYKDDYPVVFVNAKNKSLKNVTITERLKDIYIPPYYDDLLNDYLWFLFMNFHVGYSPETYSGSRDSETERQIELMPHYPDDGSIKIMDEKIFVKF